MPEDSRIILNRLITDRRTFDRAGAQMEVTGAISLPEAGYIKKLILENKFSTCLETGVAYGASTVAICSALKELAWTGTAVRHYGVDPCQTLVYGGAAVAALKECGLDDIFEMSEEPSHLALPKLVERGLLVDFVFIDGMHTFDYTLLDLFYSDKLLKPGGVICIHDMQLPSKKSALRYLMGHREYVRLPSLKRPFGKRMGAALKEAFQRGPGSGWSQLITVEPMAVVKKLSHFEPSWDFYSRI